MAEPLPGFFRRFIIAFSSYWRILADPDFARDVSRLRSGEFRTNKFSANEVTQITPIKTPHTPVLKEAVPEAALQLLGLLQQDGRFIDFIQEDIVSFSDGEVGAAARVVHEGCRKALQEHFTLACVREENEGVRVTVAEGFDASSLRLTGNVTGRPPFNGTLVHRGWQVTKAKLPRLVQGHNVYIVAPAEVEL